MAVPNTNTFGLSDVRAELDLSSTASLQDCFNAAVARDFDSAYSGNKDSLYSFRNYGNTPSSATLVITPSSFVFSSSPATQYMNVQSNSDWVVSPTESWITASPQSGTGNAVVNISVQLNVGGQRYGNVEVSTTGVTPGVFRNAVVEQN